MEGVLTDIVGNDENILMGCMRRLQVKTLLFVG